MIGFLRKVFFAYRPLNACLIAKFDESRLGYMLLWFPLYQIGAFLLFGGIGVTWLGDLPGWVPLGFVTPLTVYLGLILFASWYLSCFLFAAGYFGFCSRWMGRSGKWVERQFMEIIDWFRETEKS